MSIDWGPPATPPDRRLYLRENVAYRPANRPVATSGDPSGHGRMPIGWHTESILRLAMGDDVADHLLRTGVLVEDTRRVQ